MNSKKIVFLLYIVLSTQCVHAMEKGDLNLNNDENNPTAYKHLDEFLADTPITKFDVNDIKTKYVLIWLQDWYLSHYGDLNSTISHKYLDPFYVENNNIKLSTSIKNTKDGQKIDINNYPEQDFCNRNASNLDVVKKFLNLATAITNKKIYDLNKITTASNALLEYHFSGLELSKKGYPKKFFSEYWKGKEKYPLQISINNGWLRNPICSNDKYVKNLVKEKCGGISLTTSILGGGIVYGMFGSTVGLPIIGGIAAYNLIKYGKNKYDCASLLDNLDCINKDINVLNTAINNTSYAKELIDKSQQNNFSDDDEN